MKDLSNGKERIKDNMENINGCETCYSYGLYQMITSGNPYCYSGDIPCLRCKRFCLNRDEYQPKFQTISTSNFSGDLKEEANNE